jgi:hypothetical protein
MVRAAKPVLIWVAAFASTACLLGAHSASAAVYWEGGGAIGAANLDGTAVESDYVSAPSPSDSQNPHCGLAVDGGFLYWAGDYGIGRVNLEGTAVPRTIVPQLQGPCGVAVDSSHVYWASPVEGSIGRANLDGSDAAPHLIPGLERPCAVAVDANYVYWMGLHGIGRAKLDGSDPEPTFIPGVPHNCSLAVDTEHIYWPSFGQIGRAKLDGSEADAAFITGLGEGADAVAIDANHIYWRDRSLADVDSSIGRAGLGGGEVERQWIPTQPFEINGLAVDGRPSPSQLSLVPLSFRIGKVSHILPRRAVALTIHVSEPGELRVTSPGLRWHASGGPSAPLEAGIMHLEVWAGKTGHEANRIRRQLRHRGAAPAIAHVFFDGELHVPVTLSKRLVLRKRLHTR